MQIQPGKSPTQTPSASATTSPPSATHAGQPQLRTAPDSGYHGLREQLFNAVRNGDTKAVAILLADGKLGVDVTHPISGKTALMHAALHGMTDMARYLLELNADVNKVDRSGRNALMHATRRKNDDMVKFLLSKNANANQVSNIGDTPLKLAALACDATTIHALVMKRARVNQTAEEECTPLHMAALGGNVSALETLIRNDANPNATTQGGKTPLMLAAREGQVEVVEALLKTHAHRTLTDSEGKTAMDHAVAGQHWAVVTLLAQSLGRSANQLQVSRRNQVGPASIAPTPAAPNIALATPTAANAAPALNDALQDAAARGDTTRVQTLIASGADINAQKDGRSTPLMTGTRNNRLETVKVLLTAGADVDLVHRDGFTAMMWAAEHGCTDIAILLLQANADVNRCLANGKTALSLAAQHGHIEIVKHLIGKSNAASRMDAIAQAALENNTAIIRVLVEGGADVNARKDDRSMTPLMLAIAFNHLESVKLLVTLGARLDLKSKNGKTALALATENKKQEIVQFLRSHGASV